MADLLFNRKVKVTIASPVKEDFKSISVDVLEVEDLRVQFKVDKTTGKEPNTAEVIISNLCSERRANIQKAGGKFILQAGYDSGVGQLFIGDIRNVDHRRDGANWHTFIKSGDGERAFRFARVNETFRAGTSAGDIVLRLATLLGVGTGNASLVAGSLVAQYVNGFTSFGSVAAELERVLTAHGITWSIQDGELQLVRSTDVGALLIPDLSPDTGLIGSPEFGAADKNKGTVIKAKSLIQPRIAPGGRVRLNSERYKGEVKVTKVSHDGDTAGGNWYTSFEGVPL